MLRIEDTDLERSTGENVAQILDALRWLELDWDEGPISQVERADRHTAALERLLESGAAYRDSATAEQVRAWKAEHGDGRGYRGTPDPDGRGAVRLRVPDDGETVVHDLIRGAVSFPNRSYDDFVIARADGSVLYNFAVAVDDAEMEITDVIRGDDHLSNTPKQILVLEALGFPVPRYAHVPLLHGPDGKKLSKRHGAASVQELRAAGYLPEAVRNYVALLGWGPGDDETLLSTAELVRRFQPEDVKSSAATFDEQKLRWMNGRYMREMDPARYVALVASHLAADPGAGEAAGEPVAVDDPRFAAACEIAQEKAQTLDEVWPLIRFAFSEPVDDPKARKKWFKGKAVETLESVREVLAGLPEDDKGVNRDGFTVERIQAVLEPLPDRLGLGAGKVYQPIRVAITGTSVSPGIFESVSVLGREQTLSRIDRALDRIARAEPEPAS